MVVAEVVKVVREISQYFERKAVGCHGCKCWERNI